MLHVSINIKSILPQYTLIVKKMGHSNQKWSNFSKNKLLGVFRIYALNPRLCSKKTSSPLLFLLLSDGSDS